MVKRPQKKERRGKQTLIINIILLVVAGSVAFGILIDSLREKGEIKESTAIEEKATPLPELPMKTPDESRMARQDRGSSEYSKYQIYFEERDGVDEGTFQPQSSGAVE